MIRIRHSLIAGSLLLAATLLPLPVRALQSAPPAPRRPAPHGSKAARVPGSRAKCVDPGLMTPDEEQFFTLVNHERGIRHLTELKPDPLLVQIAREHSREMCEKNYFDHISPTPGLRTPMDRYLRALPHRPDHVCVGENLFYCSIVDVERGHRALMNSPEHRANILYPPFRRAGIGIYVSDTGEFWVTEMFLTTES